MYADRSLNMALFSLRKMAAGGMYDHVGAWHLPASCLATCGFSLCLEATAVLLTCWLPSAGGGFHRYSVDEFWHIPHFEKVQIHVADHSHTLQTYHSPRMQLLRCTMHTWMRGLAVFVPYR
jgi:hypothetical protein